MMTDKQLITRFLELQEQAEHMSDEQLRQALDDEQLRELAEQMAFAKRAFKNEDTAVPSVDEEWARFEAAHSAPFTFRKVAATFIGIVVASGIAFAAIHIVRNVSAPKTPTAQTTPVKSVTTLASDIVKADTIAEESLVFNNVALEKILTEIAATHHIHVEFQNKEARQLRFHFVWKCGEDLSRTVEKLNTFEAVDIVVENEKLIVR